MLTAVHLTRKFGDRVAVDDASLSLAPGEIFALLGPNGAGKTTTLRMLAGLIAPTSGHVTVNGHQMTRKTASTVRGRIGFLTEAPGLWDRLTVTQNLRVYARLQGVAEPERAVRRALETFSLVDRAHQPAAELSKGLKQRVALARTLLHEPDVVLLDEPTSGLDPETARDVRQLILSMRDQGRAVLLSTHNLDEVERVADRVGVLRTKVIAIDTPAALRARLFQPAIRLHLVQTAATFRDAAQVAGVVAVTAEDRVLRVSVDNAAVTAPVLVRALVQAGADIQSVVPVQASLEEVYLRLLGGDIGERDAPTRDERSGA